MALEPQRKYRFISTQDGSPTISVLKDDGESESMHNERGALAESLYIYGEAAEFVFKYHWPRRFLSLGLGLGYNELIIAALLLKHQFGIENTYIETFESDEWLRTNFEDWVSAQPPAGEDEEMWAKVYDQVCEGVAAHYALSPSSLRDVLHELLQKDAWKIRGPLSKDTQFDKKFSCILYDAFSSKTSPELWQEEFLTGFLSKATDDQCIIATYAATGNLNRTLRAQGFLIDARPGYGGKRQSTFAIKSQPQDQIKQPTA